MREKKESVGRNKFIVEATSSEQDEREKTGSKMRDGGKRDVPGSRDKRDAPDGQKEKPASKQQKRKK